jgi:hypothetical protein
MPGVGRDRPSSLRDYRGLAEVVEIWEDMTPTQRDSLRMEYEVLGAVLDRSAEYIAWLERL